MVNVKKVLYYYVWKGLFGFEVKKVSIFWGCILLNILRGILIDRFVFGMKLLLLFKVSLDVLKNVRVEFVLCFWKSVKEN